MIIFDKIQLQNFTLCFLISFARNINAEKYIALNRVIKLEWKSILLLPGIIMPGMHIYEKNSEADISSNILFS